MGIGWGEVVAGSAYVALLAVAVLVAGVAYGSARSNIKEAGSAFASAAFAIFWAFKGYPLCHAVISGDAFSAAYWSWFANRTFDFSWGGFAAFFGIVGSCMAFAVGYAVIVSLTVWNVPTLGRSRSELKINAALFIAVLGLDYAWWSKAPGLLF
ncbi:MAG: hypothetical protein WA194_01130 [Patescibacteria group bacterium]